MVWSVSVETVGCLQCEHGVVGCFVVFSFVMGAAHDSPSWGLLFVVLPPCGEAFSSWVSVLFSLPCLLFPSLRGALFLGVVVLLCACFSPVWVTAFGWGGVVCVPYVCGSMVVVPCF